jgi:retinol dehydrogenase-12
MEFFRLLNSLFFVHLPLAQKSLEGKTIVITGANVGLGYECAIQLAKCKPKVLILACRSVDKANAAAKEIIAQSGFHNVQVMELDLSKYKSVIAFAKQFQESHKQLDLLVENAGVTMREYHKTEDDHELTFQTNQLGHNLLTFLLLPQLRAAPNPRLVVVTSEVHAWTKLTLEQATVEWLDKPENFKVSVTYFRSKLCNIFFTNEFHNRFSDIEVNAVNPSLCKSELGRDITEGNAFLKFLVSLIGRTSEYGARNLTWAALDAPGNGEYISDCSVVKSSEFSRSIEGEKVQAQLWQEMERELKKAYPAIKFK